MGWDWNTYMSQPINFIKIIDLIQQLEAEESQRQWRQQHK